MILSDEDGALFFKLWLPLVEYVNKRFYISKRLTIADMDASDMLKVSEKICNDPDVIDLYLDAHPEIPEEHREIIDSWKRGVYELFVIERHLKNGSIFISADTDEVYQVSGILSEWKEIYPDDDLPLVVETMLLPFKGVIISSGVSRPYVDELGDEERSALMDIYINARRSGLLRRSL